jgi:hypothetical protein
MDTVRQLLNSSFSTFCSRGTGTCDTYVVPIHAVNVRIKGLKAEGSLSFLEHLMVSFAILSVVSSQKIYCINTKE